MAVCGLCADLAPEAARTPAASVSARAVQVRNRWQRLRAGHLHVQRAQPLTVPAYSSSLVVLATGSGSPVIEAWEAAERSAPTARQGRAPRSLMSGSSASAPEPGPPRRGHFRNDLLLPLDGARRLAGDVEGHPVDLGHLVG